MNKSKFNNSHGTECLQVDATAFSTLYFVEVLSFVPVMARTSKLMRPFLDEGDGSLHELAARTLHQALTPIKTKRPRVLLIALNAWLFCQAKVMTIRTVWKDLMEPLKAAQLL